MSAPDTDTEKQAVQHRGPLRGMFAVVLFAIVLLAGLAIYISNRGGPPEGAEATVDGRSGAAEPATGAGSTDAALPDAAGSDASAINGPAAPATDAAAPLVTPEASTGADAGTTTPADDSPETGAVSEPAAPATTP